jgi:hypothetical protein
MRPVVPAPGDDIEAARGGDVIDFIGSKWRYVPLLRNTVLNGVAGVNADTTVEITTLPANDPTVKAVQASLMIRRTDTNSSSANVKNFDGTPAMSTYSSGVSSRGGSGPSGPVMVGGVNNRQIKWNASSVDATVYLYTYGYWVQDSDEPAAGTTDPIHSALDPTLPQAGELVTVDWAETLIAKAARAWRFVPLSRATVLNQVTGAAVVKDVEITPLPDDPRIVAASIETYVRDPGASSSAALELYDYDGALAGVNYLVGVTNRYHVSGPYIVMTGGASGKVIKYKPGTTAMEVWMFVSGYWIADEGEA